MLVGQQGEHQLGPCVKTAMALPFLTIPCKRVAELVTFAPNSQSAALQV